MKNLKISFAVLTLAFVVAITTKIIAATTPTIEVGSMKFNFVTANSQKSFLFELQNAIENELVEVTLSNEEGVVLTSHAYQGRSEYKQRFNMNAVADGTYTFHITSPKADIIETLVVKDANVEILNDRRLIYLAPEITVAPKNVTTKVTLPSAGAINISILDYAGTPIFNENNQNVTTFTKRYLLSSLPKGSYTFRVETANKIYEKEVELK